MTRLTPRLTVGALIVAAIIGINVSGDAQNYVQFETDNIQVLGLVNLLLIFSLFALLIERGCEILMSSLTNLGLLPKKDETNPDVQRIRGLASTAICWIFSALVTLGGLRLITSVLDLVSMEDITFNANTTFAYTDVILTALILSGGSDAIHQIIQQFLNNLASSRQLANVSLQTPNAITSDSKTSDEK